MPLKDWSTTDADNDDADLSNSIRWTEGQAPSTVNNSARAMMTQIKRWYDEIAGGTIFVPAANVAGTADAITLTTDQAGTYAVGQRYAFIAEADNTAAVTINVDAQGTRDVKHRSTALGAGTIKTGELVIVVDDGTDYELVTTLNKATVAEVQAASTGGHAITSDLLKDAAAPEALTDAVTVAVDWASAINFTLTITANRTLGNPTNEIPGTYRTVLVEANTSTARTLSFGSEYGGATPTLTDITDTQQYLLTIYCPEASKFLVTAIDGSDP